MVVLKGMEIQTDCQKCPFMVTDGTDTLSPVMCLALWATKHEVKHCIQGKILDDCPLVEIGDKDECATYEYKGAKTMTKALVILMSLMVIFVLVAKGKNKCQKINHRI